MTAGVLLTVAGQLDAALTEAGQGNAGILRIRHRREATEVSTGWLAALLLVLAYGGRTVADHGL